MVKYADCKIFVTSKGNNMFLISLAKKVRFSILIFSDFLKYNKKFREFVISCFKFEI